MPNVAKQKNLVFIPKSMATNLETNTALHGDTTVTTLHYLDCNNNTSFGHKFTNISFQK